jgi:hypothetical protein
LYDTAQKQQPVTTYWNRCTDEPVMMEIHENRYF